MEATRFDTFAKYFATRRLSRRQAMFQGGAGLAAATLATTGLTNATSAQNTAGATPVAGDDGPTMLFIQAFRAGSVVARDDAAGRYILRLEQGLGHTVYFSDRPDRIVGAAPTPQFLDGLGFPDDNPPNAALVVETAEGETEIAVLELFSPVYDQATHTATYEVAVLGEWERAADMSFIESDADLAEVLPEFGAAHLFIDDCPDATIACYVGSTKVGTFAAGRCWEWEVLQCQLCDADSALQTRCNQTYTGCQGSCRAAECGPLGC